MTQTMPINQFGFTSSGRTASNQAQASAIYYHSFKILLVEDTELIQMINKKTLQSFGCVVYVANNGIDALNFYKQNHYDLIILDIDLPDISGLDVCKTIRIWERVSHNNHTPIAALTARDKAIEQECYTAGFDDFYLGRSAKISLFSPGIVS